MHMRKQMILRVNSGELTISGAAKEYGVTRNTVKLWIARSNGEPLIDVSERSRRPVRSPRKTPDEVEEKLLELKARWPHWGAKKLLVKLWPDGSPISLRTGDRILKRNGLVRPRRGEVQPVQRFERELPNELWQMDFKGLGRYNPGYWPLTVLDDASRFCLAFEPQATHRAKVTFENLWMLFGIYGLPDAILTDNEPCFAEITHLWPSWLESQLWLLGIRTLHGRPYHPQTQGKVERFHETAQLELGAQLRQPSMEEARRVYAPFVHDYNYERPHESLHMKVPGEVYRVSLRPRPNRIPEQEFPTGAIVRKVDVVGQFTYRSRYYFAGKGLGRQYLELREEAGGMAVYFAGHRISDLEALRV